MSDKYKTIDTYYSVSQLLHFAIILIYLLTRKIEDSTRYLVVLYIYVYISLYLSLIER